MSIYNKTQTLFALKRVMLKDKINPAVLMKGRAVRLIVFLISGKGDKVKSIFISAVSAYINRISWFYGYCVELHSL